MATQSVGNHQQVLENLQKSGTLNRKTVISISQSQSTGETSKIVRSCSDSSQSKPGLPHKLEDRRIVLIDGTQIIIESANEFVLVGPKGAKIIISCLPLFSLPDTAEGMKMAATNSPCTLRRQQIDKSLSLKTGKAGFEASQTGWVQFSQSVDLEVNGKHDGSMESDILEPLPRLDDVFDSSPGNDVFNYLDPFSGNNGTGTSPAFEESTRDRAFDEVFAKATAPTASHREQGEAERQKAIDKRIETGSCSGDLSDSDDNFFSDESPFSVEYVDKLPKNRAASISFIKQSEVINSTSSGSSGKPNLITVLPPPPFVSVIPRYETKGGWLIKLSHRKGVFGDKWQKRYFILNGPILNYFKKYGDSRPRGAIKLLPGSWCSEIRQGSPRMNDAVAKSDKAGIISVNRCLAVHRPNNFAGTISALLASEGAVDAFSSLNLAFSNPEDASRTFYMIAPSEQERHLWVEAISHNIIEYSRSREALDVACDELQGMLKSVGCDIDKETMPSVLLGLYQKKDELEKRQMDVL
ncbi:PREDICTED: uncharacterized protein LOC100634423 [Amphimedon queenslandica]|uniref:PH domain-containing protein n=1 Tax=Amphimedon queenslandica TaxID=400682 RepID=A0A1X7VQ88_AMPQE|nr:PREDICTED: uncharacterized protein LOC100634423 [Amphimedon queenslandica]|eukprot:XP_003383244.1 PREDICTED: uncharacterized protein LOC100634423 [Amphimedon queenslandica]